MAERVSRPITAEDIRGVIASIKLGPRPIFDATVAHGLSLAGFSDDVIRSVFGYLPDAEAVLGRTKDG